MALVEPVPDSPAAVANLDDERALVVADYHAGIEAGLRYEKGVDVDSRAEQRRERLRSLVTETTPDRLIFLGDLMHSIGDPGGAERGEVEVLLETLPADRSVTLVKGNHDGDVESWVGDVSVTPGQGVRIGSVGFVHGHTWPTAEVLSADVVCIGHEHPCVRLEDEVGGTRVEQAWLRGPIDREAFVDRHPDLNWNDPELVVFPAFNGLSGGTWVNVSGRQFLSPFLPAGLADGQAYLLDGTRLGSYRDV